MHSSFDYFNIKLIEIKTLLGRHKKAACQGFSGVKKSPYGPEYISS
jgi:hypothetical protein